MTEIRWRRMAALWTVVAISTALYHGPAHGATLVQPADDVPNVRVWEEASGGIPAGALSIDIAPRTVNLRPLPHAFGSSAAERWLPGGELAADSVQDAGDQPSTALAGDDPSGPKPVSIGRSLLFSALVPGAGELYAGSWGKAAVFFGIEALGWGLYLNWDGKGGDIEDEFRQTANVEWDPLSYLSWRTSTISRNSSITHALPCSSFAATVSSTHPIEQALADCESGEKQQYYELIGKYDQFVSGWADVVDQNGSAVQPTAVDSAENFNSAVRETYEDRRNDSNRFLKRASNIAGLLLVNHMISAMDAARVARSRNRGEDEASIAGRTRWAFTLREDSGGKSMPMLMAYKPLPLGR